MTDAHWFAAMFAVTVEGFVFGLLAGIVYMDWVIADMGAEDE